MFERMTAHAEQAAARKARRTARKLAEAIATDLPRDIRAKAVGEGVSLCGRGLRRRFALDPVLRWMMGVLVR